MKKITVVPSVITIAGSREALDAVDVISTEPIDLEKAPPAPATFEKKVKLVLPTGVQVQSGEREVTVSIYYIPPSGDVGGRVSRTGRGTASKVLPLASLP